LGNQTDGAVVQEVKDADGKLLKSISMKDGVPHGETQIFDENGQLANKLNYDSGQLSGPAEFFFAGKPTMIASFANGKLEGEATLFSNGVKVGVTNFKDGLFDGEFTSFDNVGNVIRVATYAGGLQNGECKTFYPDGTLMEHSTYKNNLQDGEVTKYFPSGNVLEISTFQDGKPCVIETYDEDGDLTARKEIE
jgi:antitoxin component YwqK of YwqJK toxin-antitoxin module